MKRYYAYLFLAVLFIVYLTVTVNGALYFEKEDEIEIAYSNNNLLRLHIIADSNSPYDQYQKRMVRNQLTDQFKNLNKNKFEKVDMRKIEDHLAGILEKINGPEEITATIGDYEFPRRTYGNITLDSGVYKAVRIKLGQGQGANWWCVLVPSLCLGEETEKVSLSSKKKVEYKFKLLEFFRNLNKKNKPAINFDYPHKVYGNSLLDLSKFDQLYLIK